MDTKTVKNNLKKAKEAIKNKDVNTALNLCKAVLKEDRNNYIALVLLGAALQESETKDQTPNAYRKAIEVSPDQILAWQGLAVYYEKESNNKNAEHLLPVYQKLLLLESDSSKWCEIVFKLQAVITKFGSDEFLGQILATHKATEDNAKIESLRKLVTHCLPHITQFSEQNLKLFEEVLSDSDTDSYQVYFKVLYIQQKTSELLEIGEKLFEKNRQDLHIAEWVCKACSEEFVDNRSNVSSWCSKLPQYYDCLLEADSGNVLGLMAQGAHLMSQHAYVEARQCLQRCLSESGGLFHALCMMAETQMHLLCIDETLKEARAANTLRPDHIVPRAVLAKTMALTDEHTFWEKAVSLAAEVLAEQSNELAAEGLCQAKLKLGQWNELQQAVGKLTHNPALAELFRLEAAAGSGGEGMDLLSTLAENTPNCPEAWYRLGRLYLAAESLNSACTAFLKCAKLAPHWYTAYMELGNLYSRTPETLDKARRCYQRVLVLRPHYQPAQVALSDAYRSLGDMKSNLELLQDICQHVEGRWAWPRLGLQYSDLGDATAAINCLQSALKSNPDDSHMWEALADAYLVRGANGSALRSYQRVLELKPGAFYPALQIATIKQITDLPEESLLEFRVLVEQQPHSILALKGLCETCVFLAKDFLARRLLGKVRDRLQEGLTALSVALEIKQDLACLWKLAGDCLTMAGSLPGSWGCLEVSTKLCPKAGGPQTLQGVQLLELGARCFCRCLKLMPETSSALVWHDLALNYLRQVWCSGRNTAVCKKALAAAKQSVTLDSRRWQNWNILGIVATLPDLKAYNLAQHAFIKATMVDDTVAVPWSNLGCLYLGLGELKLANAAFSAAQRIDSEYCPSWVGQAMIAERVNNEETMDLFRHTTQLGYHIESCMGYAQWVCQTLQQAQPKDYNDPHYIYSIERMYAVPVAINALMWATEELEDACGLNMLGCLLECGGLYKLSVAALSRAAELALPSNKDKVLANFARVLLKAGNVDSAIEVYKAITKADIHSQCGLALALYKGKQYQEAYEAYEAALNWWVANDTDKAHLQVAMAAVVYKLAGPDKAKDLLLQGNQMKPVSVHGLFATCALGILNSDLGLSKMVLKDLIRFQDDPDCAADVALFMAYTKFIDDDPSGSVYSMSEAVHRQPHIAAHWLQLALLMLNKQSISADPAHKVVGAAQCALTAMVLGRSKMDVSKVLAVASLSYLLGGKIKEALDTSQQAVHLYPNVGECWAVLAASCYVAQIQAPLRALISRARQYTELERQLAKWMSNFERKISLLAS